MAQTLRLTFDSGEETTLSIKARGLVDAERQYGKNLPPLEATFYAAWVQLGKPSTFDAWLDTVDDFDRVEDPTEAPAT